MGNTTCARLVVCLLVRMFLGPGDGSPFGEIHGDLMFNKVSGCGWDLAARSGSCFPQELCLEGSGVQGTLLGWFRSRKVRMKARSVRVHSAASTVWCCRSH